MDIPRTIKAVRDFSLKHYTQHCDVVIECYSDDDIIRDFIGCNDSLDEVLLEVCECAEQRLEGYLNCEAHLHEGREYLATSTTPTKADVKLFVEAFEKQLA